MSCVVSFHYVFFTILFPAYPRNPILTQQESSDPRQRQLFPFERKEPSSAYQFFWEHIDSTSPLIAAFRP